MLGLMSGTSLDGLDMACCRFSYENDGWQFEILAAECVPYSLEWKQKLHNAYSYPGKDLLLLHKEYGFFLGQKARSFLKANNLFPDAIASHGHTIFHEPKKYLSFQLGDGAAISALTKLPVISDFRSLDVCAGGQGAPLVPIGDQLLFSAYDFCLNLGGIANISYEANRKRLAYDISPCNLLLNYFAKKQGLEYDEDGALARAGKVNEELLNRLNAWPYYHLKPPKSLDKESLMQELLPLTEGAALSAEDTLATVAEHIACQVGKSVKEKDTLQTEPKMLITGGGAWNKFLVERIASYAPARCIVPDERTINDKEALVFAFLGLLRLLNEPNCLASVTGAQYDNVGGALYGNFKNF